MIKNILKKIKENSKILITFIIIFILFTMPLSYYIETPGGIIDASKRFSIEDSYKIKGTYNLAYVGQLRATIPLLIYSKINKDWEVLPKEEVVLYNETYNEAEFRDHLMLEEANNNAIKVAYNKASKKYVIEKNDLYVTYVDELAETNIKIKDQIINIDGKNIKEKSEINDYIQSKKVGDKLKIKVKNDGKYYYRYAKVIEYENKKMIGIIITEKQKIKTDPKIELKFKNSESGASGGLMMSLSIYDSLIKEDLTKGLKIAGTGTIDQDGNVGKIDGVKYKVMGAVKDKADIFLVPAGSNYKEAIKTKKEKKYKIKIIKVKTLDEAISKLKKNG